MDKVTLRITVNETTEIEWAGPGWYDSQTQFTYASGEWERYFPVTEDHEPKVWLNDPEDADKS